MESASQQLQSAVNLLAQAWDAAKNIWDDQARFHFDDRYMTPLETQVRETQLELDYLAEVIASARRTVH